MTTEALQRASLYFNQARYNEAEREVKRYLSDYPDAVVGLQLYADILSAKGQNQEALAVSEHAIMQAPDDSDLLAQRSLILYRLDREPEAIRQLEDAIRINPMVASYHGIMAELLLSTKQYEKALEAANRGLALDPDDTFCLNVRAKAQVKLKKGHEALATIATSLEQEPGNSYTHANLGWSKLEIEQTAEAQEHFREALRLDPNNQYAQAGMVEAIKARNIFYRLFLRYVFWMNRMSAQYQWAFIIGIYVGYRVVRGIANSNPDLAPYLQPLLYAYIFFALSTWFFEPISNLFLLLHPYGKFLLSKEEKRSSQLVGGMLLIGLAAFGIHFFAGLENENYLLLGMGSIAMMIPLSAMNGGRTDNDKKLLRGSTIGLGLAWIWGLLEVLLRPDSYVFTPFAILFLGVFIFQWLAIAKSTSRY